MSVYVIGDLQGCYQALLGLLDKISFEPEKDKLWFAGDLVNRGPDSLNTLRLVKEIAHKVVLGNHDLHLLACYYGSDISPKKKDTLQEILDAPDVDDLMAWLREQPLMVWSKKRNAVMTHAGVPHIWSMKQAYSLSKEVSAVLRSDKAGKFFDHMYGNAPAGWDDGLEGYERLRVITNYFTRMRFVDQEGRLEFAAKESISSAPEGFKPWFTYPADGDGQKVFFGHWAALEGQTDVADCIATDTGCVWGGALSAHHIKSGRIVRYECDC